VNALMLRRSIDALALAVFPASVLVAGWLYPRTDPVSGTPPNGRTPWMVAIVVVGAVTSIVLAVVRRRLRIRGRGAEPEAMGWLISGWPLPLPRWRSRTGFVRPPETTSTSPTGAAGPAGLAGS
jgi:hypothetical protein